MSGRQAARAIAGLVFDIPGEDFLRLDVGLLGVIGRLAASVESLVELHWNSARRSGQVEVAHRATWRRAHGDAT